LGGSDATTGTTGRKGQRLTTLVGLALSLLLMLPASPGLAAGTGHNVSNLRDRGFTISWTSQVVEPGQVNYGTSPDSLSDVAFDDRGQTVRDYTHHVTMTGLNPDTTYYYEVVSGGVTYDDAGSPYEVTTGPGLDFAWPEMISGRASLADGATPAEGAIVYARIGSSPLLSALVGGSGVWALDLAQLRTADAQACYEHSGTDDVTLDAQDGTGAAASETVAIATATAGTVDMILTAGVTRLRVTLQAALEGRPAPPDDRWVVPVTVWVHDAGSPWTGEAAGANGAIACYEVLTRSDGTIAIALAPGTYDIRVKGRTTLMNLVESIVVTEGLAPVDIGTLVEGDIDGDNTVSALDRSAMVACFGYAVDDPSAPADTAACDLNSDGYVTALDYSAFIMNLGRTGAE